MSRLLNGVVHCNNISLSLSKLTKLLISLLNYSCESSYHQTLARTHDNKFGQRAQNTQKSILVIKPKYNGSKLKRCKQLFYASAFSTLMKMHMQTKHTKM